MLATYHCGRAWEPSQGTPFKVCDSAPPGFGVAGPAGAGLFAEDPEMEQGGTEKQRQNGLGKIIAASIEVHRHLGPGSAVP